MISGCDHGSVTCKLVYELCSHTFRRVLTCTVNMGSFTRLVIQVPALFYFFEVAPYVGVESPFVKCYI